MDETATTISWMNAPYAHSPTNSVDSGVELSPRRSFNIGPYSDCCDIFSSDIPSPESPLYSSISSQVEEYNFGYSGTSVIPVPNQLTPDELLDSLSSSSPISIDQQPSPAVSDLDEICSQYLDVPTPSNFDSVNVQGPNDSTQKRRLRQQERYIGLLEAHPDIDPCLVPKSGTSKPRQSRKRRRTATTESMAGGQGGSMSYKRCYTGARVKVTAKERLQQLRNRQQVDVAVSEPLRRNLQTEEYERTHKRRCPVGAAETGSSYREGCTASSVSHSTGQAYTHSVTQILDHHRYGPDKLEMCIAQFLKHQNQRPLQEYAAQHVRVNSEQSYVGRDESALLSMIARLNEKRDRYESEDMRIVTEFICEMFKDKINEADLNGETPIYKAALYGNEGVVQGLMNYGASPWKKEKRGGETALHAAVRSKRPGVVGAILDKAFDDRCSFMLEVNSPSSDDNTPLHTATALADIDPKLKKEIIERLLKCGADPAKKNHMNQMPHYFLTDPTLKELQMSMRRLSSQKKKPVIQQTLLPPIDPQPSYCRPLTCTTQQYPAYSYEQRIPASLQHVAPNAPEPYGYGLQQTSQHYPCVTTQYVSYPQIESHMTTTTSQYYNRNIPTTQTQPSHQELDDFLSLDYS